MKKLNVSDGSTMIKNEDKKSTKAGTKKEVKKIEDQTHSLVNKVTKIDINKDEKEAETMIRNVITNNNPKISKFINILPSHFYLPIRKHRRIPQKTSKKRNKMDKKTLPGLPILPRWKLPI